MVRFKQETPWITPGLGREGSEASWVSSLTRDWYKYQWPPARPSGLELGGFRWSLNLLVLQVFWRCLAYPQRFPCTVCLESASLFLPSFERNSAYTVFTLLSPPALCLLWPITPTSSPLADPVFNSPGSQKWISGWQPECTDSERIYILSCTTTIVPLLLSAWDLRSLTVMKFIPKSEISEIMRYNQNTCLHSRVRILSL